MEGEFVIYILKEKTNIFNNFRYWICVGKQPSAEDSDCKNDRIEEVAKIGRPYSDFVNAALKAVKRSIDTGWPYVGIIESAELR